MRECHTPLGLERVLVLGLGWMLGWMLGWLLEPWAALIGLDGPLLARCYGQLLAAARRPALSRSPSDALY